MDRFDVALAFALLVGIGLTGQVVGLLESAGFTTLSSAVWPLGYGAIIVTAWYVWIRPLDLHAPAPSESGPWESDPADDRDSER